MLGRNWRLRVNNTQNQAITVTVTARLFNFDSSGAPVWSSEQTLINAVSVSATTGTTVSSDIDNSTDKYIGMSLLVSMTAANTTNSTGDITLLLERSTDGGTTWPSADRGGLHVGSAIVVAADTTNQRRANFEVR